MSYGQYSYNTADRTNPLRSKTASTDQKGKRVKQVYKTDEIPHLWAHKTQSSARNSQGNLYFDGDTIYSYGSHFPIAKHVHSDVIGKDAVLLTSDSYSTTTALQFPQSACLPIHAGHIHAVRRAIPDGVKVFPVGNLRGSHTPKEIINDLVSRAKENAHKLAQGFLKPLMHRNKRVELYRAIQKDVEQAREMQEFFGHVARAEMPAVLTTIQPHGIETLEALCTEVDRAKQERRAKQESINEAKRKRSEEKYAKQRALDALNHEEKIAAWRVGEPVNLSWGFRGIPTMLRIAGDEVETSLGARFPLEHAVRALRLYRVIRARGERWERNGHNIHLGHYQIDSIEVDGTVRAGCHVVTAEEVERLAKLITDIAVQAAISGMTMEGEELPE